ncbi:uncharacterized protein [Triticum aestivum]|uniref:uncharacterized protein n=1 Tax=Triticum aestivum TaxID=4565 RepID=UPI001D00551D|nr:uncharacterized protein LOC123183105 [Triticum aestivum]
MPGSSQVANIPFYPRSSIQRRHQRRHRHAEAPSLEKQKLWPPWMPMRFSTKVHLGLHPPKTRCIHLSRILELPVYISGCHLWFQIVVLLKLFCLQIRSLLARRSMNSTSREEV